MANDDLAILLGKRFIQRKDVKAVQHNDGAYSPDRTPWKMGDLRSHVAGTRTFGHYLVGTDDLTKVIVFDLDLRKEGYWLPMTEEILEPQVCNPREVWLTPDHPGKEFLTIQLRTTAEAIGLKAKALYEDELHVAIAYSGGKGVHVYLMPPEPIPASVGRKIAAHILRAFNGPDGRPGFAPTRGENFWVTTAGTPNIEIEVYPKQDSLAGKDLGNLVRLPLGVNRKTGQMGFFLDCRCGYNELRVMDPMEALGGVLPWD